MYMHRGMSGLFTWRLSLSAPWAYAAGPVLSPYVRRGLASFVRFVCVCVYRGPLRQGAASQLVFGQLILAGQRPPMVGGRYRGLICCQGRRHGFLNGGSGSSPGPTKPTPKITNSPDLVHYFSKGSIFHLNNTGFPSKR